MAPTEISSSSSIYIDETVAYSTVWSDVKALQIRSHNILYTASRYGRRFLLKGLSEEAASLTEYRLQQEREFRLGVSLVHPNIAATYGLEKIKGVGTCIIQELIDGQTLNEWLATKPSAAVKQRVFDQLLSALNYLHSRQLVHHDLKSDNILITRNGANVKLIDFGLSFTDDALVSIENDPQKDIRAIGKLIPLLLPGYFRPVARRCINGGYPNIAALQRAVEKRRRYMAIIPTILSIILFAFAVLLFSLSWHDRVVEQHKHDQMVERVEGLLDAKRAFFAQWLEDYSFFNTESADVLRREKLSSEAYDSLALWYADDQSKYATAVELYTQQYNKLQTEAIRQMQQKSAIEEQTSGFCGAQEENLAWEIKGDSLIISGSGAMMNFPAHNASPWTNHQEKIHYILLPPRLTSIGDFAFWRFRNVQAIKIPEGVTYIGQNAFEECWALEELVIPEKVIHIGYAAFHQCGALTKLRWNARNCAFNRLSGQTSPLLCECFRLEKIEFGPHVKSIPTNLCDFLENVTIVCYSSEPPAIDFETFARVSKQKAKVYIPQTSIARYQADNEWGKFQLSALF